MDKYEQRAREIVSEPWGEDLHGTDERPLAVESIAAALRAAVEEEREACAKIADGYEEYARSEWPGGEYADGKSVAAEVIAEDIRARGEERR